MVLEDHIKRKKKLLPPMLASGVSMHDSLWHIERFPQFILLALYLENSSLTDAVDTFLQINVSYSSILRDFRGDKVFRPIRMGEHLSLDGHEKQEINRRSEGAKWRCNIDPYLNIISSLFNVYPMDYLLKASINTHNSKCDNNVKMLKSLLAKTFDSHSKTSLLIQSVDVVIELRSGNTIIREGENIPDLNTIVDYPNTKESKNAAGFVVSFECSFLAAESLNDKQPDLTWQKQFWDTCYRLEPCEFEYE